MIRAAAVACTLGVFAAALGSVPSATADPSQLVRTESGKVRCDVLPGNVSCEYLPGFPQAPIDAGSHDDIAATSSAGAFSWAEANIPGENPENDMVLDYGQTYHVLGWTILPTEDGTRLTNDGTGHGMFVSVDDVSSF